MSLLKKFNVSIGGIVFAVLLSAQSATAQAAQGVDAVRTERQARVEKVLLAQLDKVNRQIKDDPDNVSARDLTSAALLILQTGESSAAAENSVQRLFKVQNMDQASPRYGTVPWRLNDPKVQDANAIEFVMQPMSAVMLGYSDRLSDSFKKGAHRHIEAALVALANHHVSVSYTNIFLMNTVNTILLGQYMGDEASLKRGYSQWQQWLDYTSRNGIHEFDSPTYYAVDLNNLVLGYNYAAKPEIRQQFKQVLDYFWRDIAANYVPKAGHIVGTHSRDYYFLTGRGGMDFYFYLEGMLDPDKFLDIYLEKSIALENDLRNGYHPSAEILALAQLPERTIEQRWDADPAGFRYTYITPDFSIGTTNGTYEPQDKLFAADLFAAKPLVSITLVPDVFDSPYGVYKTTDRSGHPKPTHLPLNLSSVQEKGAALMMLDLNPKDAIGNNTFATNLILPPHTDALSLDGKSITVSPSLNQTAQLNSVIGLREGHSCFAARFFLADPLNGKAPTFELKADEVGLENEAIRLAVYHARSSFSSANTAHLHVGVLALATSCTDEKALAENMKQLRDAKVQVERSSTSFKASTTIAGTQLELTEDLATRLPSETKVNGVEVKRPVFSVNGNSTAVQVK